MNTPITVFVIGNNETLLHVITELSFVLGIFRRAAFFDYFLRL